MPAAVTGAAKREPPIQTALEVFAIASMSVPASWSRKKAAKALEGEIRPTARPDIDNLSKALLDGCNGVVWKYDKQVVDLRIVKRYADAPGLTVAVMEA